MTDFQLPYTYSGLLDDVVQRYPVSEEINSSFFEKMIAKNIFFGGGVLLNDGYLINHPTARKEFIREGSLLNIMLRQNFVRVLSRASTPEEFFGMPQSMADQNNQSFINLMSSPDWEFLDKTLRSAGPELFRTNNIKPWPNKKMHIGFTTLIKRIFDKSLDDLGLGNIKNLSLRELEEDFLLQKPETGSPRDKFERSVIKITSRRSIDVINDRISLMNIANQCYHYNFGMCLSPDYNNNVAVDTTIGKAFEDILDLDDIFEGYINQIPIIKIPKNLPFNRGSDFDDLLDFRSRLGAAKYFYLKSIDDIFNIRSDNKNDYDEKIRAINDASDEYTRKLAEHFSTRVSIRFWDIWMDGAITVGTGLLGEVVGAGMTAGIAIGLASNEALRGPKNFLLRRIRERHFRDEFDPRLPPLTKSETLNVTLKDIRPRFSSMAFNKTISDKFVNEIPSLV